MFSGNMIPLSFVEVPAEGPVEFCGSFSFSRFGDVSLYCDFRFEEEAFCPYIIVRNLCWYVNQHSPNNFQTSLDRDVLIPHPLKKSIVRNRAPVIVDWCAPVLFVFVASG